MNCYICSGYDDVLFELKEHRNSLQNLPATIMAVTKTIAFIEARKSAHKMQDKHEKVSVGAN